MMNAALAVSAFLGRNNFLAGGYDVNAVLKAMLFDMEEGLVRKPSNPPEMGPALDMIPTWAAPPEASPKNRTAIVIDAGGTNFRACLVSFDANGIPVISDMEKRAMPATDREYGKKEFFDTIAGYLDHLKNKADVIGFCFSYPMEITRDGDGIVTQFSKEIKAREVIGSPVGASLADALVSRGWNRPKRVVLLNDTAAALLAGASQAVGGKAYDSYVGFILGTGMNAAYIESAPIPKLSGQDAPTSQIIVCESGKCNKIPRCRFDEAHDATTNTPGLFGFEKMCSGAYLGPVTLRALKAAAADGLFSAPVNTAVASMDALELIDMNLFLQAPYKTDTRLGTVLAGASETDRELVARILDAFVERSARLAAANIAAAVVKSGKGHSPVAPVCVLCEGTTFLKTRNLRERVTGYLNQVLTEERGIYYEIVTMENAVTLGSAIAALS